MRETLVRRLSGTAFILGTTAATLVPLLAGFPLRAAPTGGARSVFLNGVDVSSARSQDLRNVDVHINESGDLFIVAPHYQVNEEDTYVPLSKFVEGLNGPKHKPPQAVSKDVPQDVITSPKAVPAAPAPAAPTAGAATEMLPKAGTPAPTPAAAAQPASQPALQPEPQSDEPPELPDDAVAP